MKILVFYDWNTGIRHYKANTKAIMRYQISLHALVVQQTMKISRLC